MRTTTPMTTADALRVNESMEKLVDSMGIKDPALRKILIDQFNEEASRGMDAGLTPDQIIAENDRRIGMMANDVLHGVTQETFETAIREEAMARGLL